MLRAMIAPNSQVSWINLPPLSGSSIGSPGEPYALATIQLAAATNCNRFRIEQRIRMVIHLGFNKWFVPQKS
ncbi:MAG: hypothetical protein GC162_05330 [Planctomycetes bacterium]|nr:hypothetical protein [Planctomycetota bacterium]